MDDLGKGVMCGKITGFSCLINDSRKLQNITRKMKFQLSVALSGKGKKLQCRATTTISYVYIMRIV
jgi:hypothetical protein